MRQDRAGILTILRRAGLLEIGTDADMEPLTGGVSSDIWRVRIGDRQYCVKRALSKLKVDADWRVSTVRSLYEAGWMQTVDAISPGATPAILHIDAPATAIVMDYLDPADHPLWKNELLEGRADPAFASAVGSTLATIHSVTAGVEPVRKFFATDRIFREIRIDPYLIATADRHPSLARRLRSLARETMANHTALVHGDVSPKNILVGPKGPVFLDAECAWYGDPAFDLAFCLNHLLLKSANRPQDAAGYLDCFAAIHEHYLEGATWEPRADVEGRTAALLPGLFLARVDGKSPVEYLTGDDIKNRIRTVAQRFIREPTGSLGGIADGWLEELRHE